MLEFWAVTEPTIHNSARDARIHWKQANLSTLIAKKKRGRERKSTGEKEREEGIERKMKGKEKWNRKANREGDGSHIHHGASGAVGRRLTSGLKAGGTGSNPGCARSWSCFVVPQN